MSPPGKLQGPFRQGGGDLHPIEAGAGGVEGFRAAAYVSLHGRRGPGEHLRGQSQMLGDEQGAAFPGGAHFQFVQGPQGDRVEFHPGAEDCRAASGEFLDFRIMGGHGEDAALFHEFLHHRHRQAHAFRGIGAGTQFVRQHQTVGGHLPENAHHGGHVGGKGGKIFRKALTVANVRQYPVKGTDFRPSGRQHQP